MGLRERKKERTRTALIDAALELFLSKGYEATTVDQIAARVDVSPRTFFRYFASKEEIPLSLAAEQHEHLLAELRGRPDGEPPFTALLEAMESMLGTLRGLDDTEAARFLQTQELIHGTPALVSAYLRLISDNERMLVAEVARRQGTEPGELHPRFVVSLFTGLGLMCFGRDPEDVAVITQRFDQLRALAEGSLRPGWDMPARPSAEEAEPVR
ncbi:TetR family transcriptional regulator [Microbispora sp. NPDC049125]|uniref:TetR family transcriptional regulator n=1 Tax=Microbispora sp. NPDC049125 TaxID=3154929 RepID=UPI003465C585